MYLILLLSIDRSLNNFHLEKYSVVSSNEINELKKMLFKLQPGLKPAASALTAELPQPRIPVKSIWSFHF